MVYNITLICLDVIHLISSIDFPLYMCYTYTIERKGSRNHEVLPDYLRSRALRAGPHF